MSGYGLLSAQDEAMLLMSQWQREAMQYKGNGFLPANAFDNLKHDPNKPLQIPTKPFGSLMPGDGQQPSEGTG